MKRIAKLGLFLTAIMLLIPLPLLKKEPTAAASAIIYDEISASPRAETVFADSFRVLNHENGKISKLSAEDYITGVVLAEMPSSFPEEALKAQAVAAYTFACRRRHSNQGKEYDITTDHTTDQAFLSESSAVEKWGEASRDNIEKVKSAVKAVAGYMVTYNGDAALTVYHSTSAGKTQSAAEVWGGDLPYLKAVDSSGDVLSTSFLSVTHFTPAQMQEKLKKLCKTSGAPEAWFSDISPNSSGYVSELKICGKEISGAALREALGLKSTAMEIAYSEDKFTVTVKGNGHGVGMSQNGAAALASSGSSFEEILCHYYPGCKVEKIS